MGMSSTKIYIRNDCAGHNLQRHWPHEQTTRVADRRLKKSSMLKTRSRPAKLAVGAPELVRGGELCCDNDKQQPGEISVLALAGEYGQARK